MEEQKSTAGMGHNRFISITVFPESLYIKIETEFRLIVQPYREMTLKAVLEMLFMYCLDELIKSHYTNQIAIWTSIC